jgi:NADH dehydrogenase FAD-containing subunit
MNSLKKMTQDGISIILNTRVTEVGKGFVKMAKKMQDEETVLPASTVIWTAGISPNPVTAGMPCEKMCRRGG